MTTPRRWTIRPAMKALRGIAVVPGDKSIGHRAIILGALAGGTSTLRGLSHGEDNRATRAAMEALGVTFRDGPDGVVTIEGRGIDGLRAPGNALGSELDCGNSGTSMRLLAGVLVAQEFPSRLVGDASLSGRPMGRITRPLRGRGARIEGTISAVKKDEVAPLEIHGLDGGRRLFELEYELPVASAQVKSALLLSGLWADGVTALREPVVSRDHTERMLSVMGAPIQTMGPVVMLDPTDWDRVLAPLEITVPGDPSSSAFVVVAAHLVAGSRVALGSVCCNPTRTGYLEVLRDMGGGAVTDPRGEMGGEPVGNLHVGVRGTGTLRRGARVAGELAVRCIDEIPALVAAAACVAGESEFMDLAELRVKETDRVSALVAMVRAFGLEAETRPDGLTVSGGVPRGGARVDSHGDHRIAMAAAVLALAAQGETVVEDVACVETSFPGFAAVMRALGADIEEG